MGTSIVNQMTQEKITFLETSEQTKGQYLLLEVELPSHAKGMPLHLHDDIVKEFHVLEGTLTISDGKTDYLLERGNRRYIGQKVMHTYLNEQERPVKFRVRVAPAGEYEQIIHAYFVLCEKEQYNNSEYFIKKLQQTVRLHSKQKSWVGGKPIWVQRLFGSKFGS